VIDEREGVGGEWRFTLVGEIGDAEEFVEIGLQAGEREQCFDVFRAKT
jgi:hypothetical protein